MAHSDIHGGAVYRGTVPDPRADAVHRIPGAACYRHRVLDLPHNDAINTVRVDCRRGRQPGDERDAAGRGVQQPG